MRFLSIQASELELEEVDLWDDIISVSVSVSKNGTVDGNEVSQLYIQYPYPADQPVRQFRGFERTFIESGARATVSFSVRRRNISAWM